MSNLEERLRRLEDRAEINDVVVAYFLAADGDDIAGVGASFTEEAVFQVSGQVCASGRQSIMEFIRTARTQMGLTVHTPHYSHITFRSSREATGIVGAHLEIVTAGTSVYGAVRYLDEYRRSGEGRWQISSRDMRTIFIAPWQQAGEALASNTPVRWPGFGAAQSDFPRAR